MPEYKAPFLKEKFQILNFSDFILNYYTKAKNQEHANLLLLLYLTGARPSEITLLKRENITIEKKYIRIIFQTKKRRGYAERLILIPLASEQIKALADYLTSKVFPKEYIFPSFARLRNPRKFLIKLNEECGIGYTIDGMFYPFSFYFFRKNILTLLAMNGADVIELLFFKGASLEFIFKSAGYYIQYSREIAEKIAKILEKIIKS